MKSSIVLCVLFLAAVALARPGGGKYTDRYDNINLDELLANRKLLIPYLKCILDEGKCTPDAKELKGNIRESLENECARCTEAQKQGSEQVLRHILNNEEEYWNKLTAKYDPELKYTNKHQKELREAKSHH